MSLDKRTNPEANQGSIDVVAEQNAIIAAQSLESGTNETKQQIDDSTHDEDGRGVFEGWDWAFDESFDQ